MPIGPDSRYYVHAGTDAAKAQQDYLRDVPKSDTGWWALVFVLVLFVLAAGWILTRT